MTDALFDWAVPEPPPADESADQRRTRRQREAVQAGRNPLRGTVHPDADPATCTPDASRGRPYTCGSCRFRQLLDWHGRAYPKCVLDWHRTQSTAHVSHSGATDVRGWWPGCADYEPGDPALSPDAARGLPSTD